MAKTFIACRPRSLTEAQAEVARRRALEINPDNILESHTVLRTPEGRRGGPRRLTLVIGRRWPASGVRLTVQFLDSPAKDLRARLLQHMNAWNQTANVHFTETKGTGQVRIARLDSPAAMAGYWSYVGTEILAIPEDEPTLNLQEFTMKTLDSEFHRVVRHEAGHTLGFDHEHMRQELVQKIDRKKAFAFYDQDQGWTREETIEQVLTPLAKKSILGTTEADPTSIMCYQIPGDITKDGKPIVGGTDINAKDFAFVATIYPKKAAAPVATVESPIEAVLPLPLAASPLVMPSSDEGAFHLVILDAFDGLTAEGKEAEKPRFARLFASYGGARVTAPMRLRKAEGEAPTHFGEIIDMQKRLKDYTDREKGSLPTDKEMLIFGGSLFDTLFQGDVRRLYDEARSRQKSGQLDFILTSMIPWIAEKPWEFAYDSVRKCFLATEEVHFVRNVLTAVPAEVIPPRTGPLRILVVSAQPVAFGRLSVEQETEVIRRGFAPLIEAGLAVVDVVARVTPGMLHARLSTGEFQVVHFIGHGGFDEDTQEGFLIFENNRGGDVRLTERSAREIFCQRGVSMVFLNACQTGAGGLSDFNKGVAQSLVARGLPALVANQYSVLDSSATSFAQCFYWSLAQGLTLGQAAREARIAVNYSMQGDSIDWAVPVVYARDPDMTLATAPPRFVPFPAGAGREVRREMTRGRMVRVAMWDIDSVFPALEETLRKMNEAQETFAFELAAMSPPLDIWDLETPGPDGEPYLSANRLAERMAGKPGELRVDLLVAMTRHWMRDEDWLNLDGWWPRDRNPPVVVFSFAGFENLAAEGPATDRALTNLTVAGLAGFLANVESHETGTRTCPLYFDPEHDLALQTGPQTFDKSCRTKLEQAIPRELPGLDALLKAFL
ncbi:MAG: CHAT domain-containing protein [Acidobacteriota bacterium]